MATSLCAARLPTDNAMDAPKSLTDTSARKARRAALGQPHIAPLAAFVTRLRQAAGHADEVPDFDPFDGGVLAECLFLLEAPGGRAVGSGFVSRNNPDETAKNFFLLKRRKDPRGDRRGYQGVFTAPNGTPRVASSASSSRSRRPQSPTGNAAHRAPSAALRALRVSASQPDVA